MFATAVRLAPRVGRTQIFQVAPRVTSTQGVRFMSLTSELKKKVCTHCCIKLNESLLQLWDILCFVCESFCTSLSSVLLVLLFALIHPVVDVLK